MNKYANRKMSIIYNDIKENQQNEPRAG